MFIASCNDKQSSRMFTDDQKVIDSLKIETFKGNINAYEELKYESINKSPDYIIFWALYMSKEFDYKKANIDVVESFLGTGKRFEILNEESQNWIRSLLKEASVKGIKDADGLLISLEERLIKFKKMNDDDNGNG